MASSSTTAVVASASSSYSAATSMKKHDVFISFRGKDTRDNFTSHLHDALQRHKIQTYIDYKLEKGDEVWASLVKAIHDSSVFLVIFSENYASSTWCLNELVEIMECMEKGQHVIPIFYKIEASHVRKQSGSYETAFHKHYELSDLKNNKETIQKWKDNLTKAANISGVPSNSHEYRTESDMIKRIIELVKQKLNCKHSYELRGPFIQDETYAKIISLLSIDSNDVRIIGIWGMGGIGKTTIAEAVFSEVASQFERTCFFANVREESKKHGLICIYRRVFSELLGEDIRVDTPKVIPSFVMSRLRRMKVFIVLDDVNSLDLIENLVGVGNDWLGAGSRVIVTTRDKQVLINGGVDKIHEVKEMNIPNSLHLFSFYAFKKAHPKKGYEDLSERAIAYAKGIPLALKILGLLLCSKGENEWEDTLMKLKKYTNAEIHQVLRLSYDELDDPDKKIFLDIACFFEGHRKDEVSNVLSACGFFADIGISNLLNKALITVNSYNRIKMHDMIKEMGREIVRGASINNFGQQNRLWDFDEVCDVLRNNKGTDTIESIFLHMSQISSDLHLSFHTFVKMPNLRLLAFKKYWRSNNTVTISAGVTFPRSLRFLQWDEYPLKSVPSICFMDKLVVLSMKDSNMEKLWNGVQNFPSLKEIDLRGSRHLKECPNLSGAPKLEYLYLHSCESFCHVDPSVFSLPKLEVLYVNRCKTLKSLCSNTCSPSLRTLNAFECTNLQEFTVTLSSDQCKIGLSFLRSGLNKVPSSILHLRNLEYFCFPICESLRDLPENFNPDRIHLSEPNNPECDVTIMLRTILPSPIFQNARVLEFFDVKTLFEIPENFCFLSSLEYLSLSESFVVNIPESIKYLPNLKILHVSYCKLLRCIPALPPSIQLFDARYCTSLKIALNSKTEPSSQRPECTVLFTNCINLDEDAYDNIVKDAISRIEHVAVTFKHAYFNDDDDDDLLHYYNYSSLREVKSGKICYTLPARRKGVGESFHYSSTQGSVAIELLPNFKILGFVFYCVVSLPTNVIEIVGCKCYLENSKGERVEVISFFMDIPLRPQGTNLDHVCLWYDAKCCKKIMEAIEETEAINDASTTHNSKLTFNFFIRNRLEKSAVIECGVRCIYPSEDQTREEGRERKSKRSRETFLNGVAGSESDEPEETVHPIKRFKQDIFVEVEDLRYSSYQSLLIHT